MSLLAAASGGGWTPPPSGEPPYVIPTSAPYNAPDWIDTPTADGSGSTVHPGVVDLGVGRLWNGYRFWMAITGYFESNNDYENPHILAGQHGWDWEVPSGLTNPLYPLPPDGRFHSDTDLEYDPRTDELVLIFREKLADGTQQSFLARSHDGRTWPAKAQPLNWTRPEGGTGQVLSPAIVRRGEGDWWLFGIDYINNQRFVVYTATEPDLAWTGPTITPSVGMPATPWHFDVIWHDGAFRALVDVKSSDGLEAEGLYAGSSTNGVAWSWSTSRVLQPSESGWDSAQMYRATFTPHENGTHYRLWYSSTAGPGVSWRTAYTEVPQSLWPLPPA